MQFVVTAMDHTDPQAIERRMEHRDAHLANVKQMIAAGIFLSGGAILDAEGKMIGSTLHLEFETKEALDKHLKSDPYVAGKVWNNIEVAEMKRVPMS